VQATEKNEVSYVLPRLTNQGEWHPSRGIPGKKCERAGFNGPSRASTYSNFSSDLTVNSCFVARLAKLNSTQNYDYIFISEDEMSGIKQKDSYIVRKCKGYEYKGC
jgi:hypothetical protein